MSNVPRSSSSMPSSNSEVTTPPCAMHRSTCPTSISGTRCVGEIRECIRPAGAGEYVMAIVHTNGPLMATVHVPAFAACPLAAPPTCRPVPHGRLPQHVLALCGRAEGGVQGRQTRARATQTRLCQARAPPGTPRWRIPLKPCNRAAWRAPDKGLIASRPENGDGERTAEARRLRDKRAGDWRRQEVVGRRASWERRRRPRGGGTSSSRQARRQWAVAGSCAAGQGRSGGASGTRCFQPHKGRRNKPWAGQ